MITRGKWIILLLPILGSCKKPPTLNRAVGCTNTTLCWNHHHHLCLPCDYDHQDVQDDGQDDQDDKTSSPHEPKIGSGKDINWPPKIGGIHSLPPARSSLKNRVKNLVFLPTPTMDDWKEDKKVVHNRNKIVSEEEMGFDPQKNRMSVMRMMSGVTSQERVKGDGSPKECQDQKDECSIYISGKCIECLSFWRVLRNYEFPKVINAWRNDPKYPFQKFPNSPNKKKANKRNKIVSLEEKDYDDHINQYIPKGCPATIQDGWCYIFLSLNDTCIPCEEFLEFIRSLRFPALIDSYRKQKTQG